MEEKCLVHEYLQIFTTPDKFYIKPSHLCCDSSEVLVIDRVSGESIVKDLDLVKLLGEETDFKIIFGFLGSIKLISGLYLVVVTDRILLGKLNGHAIFQMTCADIIPYAQNSPHLTSQQLEDNATSEDMVRSMLDLPGAYFSCSYDLTHTVQKLHSVTPDFHKKSLLSRADNRFVWNRYLLKDFSSEKYGRFTLPLIQGVNDTVVSINHVTVNDQNFIWSLLSRRSVDRTGTKLFVRGIDSQGNTANHVVTEQIIEYGRRITSYVLTRGSIPLPWTEYPDLGFFPKLSLAGGDHVAMFVRHMNDQKQRYGNVVCVNLINQRGREAVLEESYRAVAAAADLPGVKYCPFDFHAECKSLRYDKLDLLIKSIAEELKEFKYFYIEDGTVAQRQSGTFRVNCMDCLDRTNVVQCILGKLQLKEALKQLDVNICDDEQFSELDGLINNVWADHADMISTQYSGTGALKTEFTRTGKRTYTGVISDVVNALIRYCVNNFYDGYKQDAFDIFLGYYVISESKTNAQLTPFSRSKNWKRITFPLVLLAAIFMFCGSIVLSESYGIEMIISLMFWGTTAVTTLRYIRRNPMEFVDWPKLSDVERSPRSKAKSV